MSTIKLLCWSAIAYAVLLVLVRGAFPSESAPTISLTGIPLIVIVVMIARDLARRSSSPTVRRRITKPTVLREDPIQFLSGQFRVAAGASNSYFENVIRGRLKELLFAKVSLEKNLENEIVRRILSDPKDGPQLLGDETLYRMLYGPTPQAGLERINLIAETVNRIGAWKG